MRRFIVWLIAALAALLALTGCGGGGNSGPQQPSEPTVRSNFLFTGLDNMPVQKVKEATNNGKSALVFYQPKLSGTGAYVPLNEIANTDAHNAKIQAAAEALNSISTGNIYLFIMDQPNQDVPWGVISANEPALYVKAWDKIANIMHKYAPGVHLVFAPSTIAWNQDASRNYGKFFPTGAEMVALIGKDFGNTQSWSDPQTPAQVFKPSLDQIKPLLGARKLMLLTATVGDSNHQKLWLGQLSTLSTQYGVEKTLWYNFNDGGPTTFHLTMDGQNTYPGLMLGETTYDAFL